MALSIGKVQRDMLAAIRATLKGGKDYKRGSIRVELGRLGDGADACPMRLKQSGPDMPAVRVYLHSNHIATLTELSVSFTLAGWNTQTTRRYINAILTEFIHANAGVYSRNSDPYYNHPGVWASRSVGLNEWVHA